MRAGRAFDAEIPSCLDATGFFVALLSRSYNASTYCRHKELGRFLSHHPPESGRLIQARLVGHNLSMDEWRTYVGEGIPYQRTCPNLVPGPGAPVTQSKQ
ncbi:MAG TPA: hypothetical protein VIY49_04335 [Bryobacteraceae bacterium]